MNPLPVSTPRPSLARSLGGIWRLTYPRSLAPKHLLSVAGLLGLFGAIAGSVASHDTPDFPGWIGRFYVTFLVPVLAFLSAAGSMRDDMRPGTVDYVLTRPVPRWAYVVFRYISHVVVLQIEFLLPLALLAVIGLTRPVPAFMSSMMEVSVAQMMMIFAFSAFGFLCATITSRYAIVGLLYGAIVEGGIGEIPTQLNRISMTHHVNTLLKPLYEVSGGLTPALAAAPQGTIASTVAILALFAAITLAAAASLFSLRELASASTDA